MDFCIYDSRLPIFKDPFGAVAAGTSVRFSICLPKDLLPSRVEFVLCSDGENDRFFPMELCESTLRFNRYTLRYTPRHPKLHFYYFQVTKADGTLHIIHANESMRGELNLHSDRYWQLTVYDPSHKRPAALGNGIIYQIFPDRFCNSGSPKQNVPADRTLRTDWGNLPVYLPNEKGEVTNSDYFGGDLAGITQHLDYLAQLGVTCLYLNPIFEAHSNHRYNTADYRRIDPMLGTEEDFRQLCREAHRRGIRVLLDGVFNHTGSNSRYFNAEGFYPELGAAQSQDSLYFDWYSFHPWPTDYDAWWGVRTLPAVNEEAPTYRDFIVRSQDSVVRHWLRQGADGWRLDVADELPDDFIAEIRQAMEAEKPDSFLLGEVWEDGSNKIAYSHRRRYLLGRETHGLMNYPFRTAALAWLRGGDASDFRRNMEEIRENYPPAAFHSGLNILGTHDTPRLLTMLGAARTPESKDERAAYRLSPEELDMGLARLRLGALLLYSFPGSPTVFYGDEAGVQGFEDPLNRGTYPWGREDPALLAYFRQLGALRKQRVSLQRGDIDYLYAVGGGLVLRRQSEDEVTVAAMNAGMQPLELSIPWSGALAKDALTGQQFFARNGMLRLTLPPVGGVLLV